MKPNRKGIRTEASNPTEFLRPELYSFTWIHIPWLSKLRCTEVVIKLFCLNGKLLDQCNIQYPEEISHNCYLHAILCTRNTLYIICSCSGLMKREKDHALIRSMAYGTLLFRGKKEKNND